MILYLPIYQIYTRYDRKKKKEQKKRKLRLEFKDSMEIVIGNLLAGYALENAFIEAEKELTELYGTETKMSLELAKINQQVKMNQPIETAFAAFAKESEVEEIENFSEVLSFAKKSGGNFVKIMKASTEAIESRITVEEEIQTMIAARKLEQKVMNAVPIFLLIYLDIASYGYLDVLYKNIGGVLFMTFCLAGYVAAIALAERITHIEV